MNSEHARERSSGKPPTAVFNLSYCYKDVIVRFIFNTKAQWIFAELSLACCLFYVLSFVHAWPFYFF